MTWEMFSSKRGAVVLEHRPNILLHGKCILLTAEIPTSGDQDLKIKSGDLFFGPAPPSPDRIRQCNLPLPN